MSKNLFDIIHEQLANGYPFAVATVVETQGSVSAKTASKAVIDQDGRVIAGWVGGGCAESATCECALACMKSGQTAMLDIDLDDEMLGAGMPCGGSMRVYVEPVFPKPRLWLLGHGRVAESLCVMGNLLGFDVIVNDPGVERDKYPEATRLITDDLDYEMLQPDRQDYVVIATQHKGDHESIQRALESQAGYIAMIASRKRSGLVMEYLQDAGVSQDNLQRVRAPAGLDLGARTPEEIALCVISEIVLLRRKGSGQPMIEKMADKIKIPSTPATHLHVEGEPA